MLQYAGDVDAVPWMWCRIPVGSPRTRNSFHASLPLHKAAVAIANKASEPLNTGKQLTYPLPIDSRTLSSTNAVQAKAIMSADQDHQPQPSSLSDKTNMGDASRPTTEEGENQMHLNPVGTGVRSDRSKWWLKFIFSSMVTALAIFLRNRFFGNPWRSRPPCEARSC